jgi:hypothetical protein
MNIPTNIATGGINRTSTAMFHWLAAAAASGEPSTLARHMGHCANTGKTVPDSSTASKENKDLNRVLLSAQKLLWMLLSNNPSIAD